MLDPRRAQQKLGEADDANTVQDVRFFHFESLYSVDLYLGAIDKSGSENREGEAWSASCDCAVESAEITGAGFTTAKEIGLDTPLEFCT